MIPRRKPRLRSGIERAPQREFPQHRQWVRQTRACIVEGCEDRMIEAAHFDGPVPVEDMGGKGLKRHDRWVFPCCHLHHREMHNGGWQAFEAKYGVNLKAAAEALAKASPHRWRWEEGQ